MKPKLLIAALSLAAAVLPAKAFTNLGFETGTTAGWTDPSAGVTFAALTQFSFPVLLTPHVVTPVAGSFFGLLTTSSVTSVALNLDFSAPYAGGDTLWLRFLSNDVTPFNDTAVVQFSGPSGFGTLASLAVPTNSPDSGWLSYAIPTGATLLTFALNNVGGDARERPYLAIDISPVPEPATPMLLLAGAAAIAFLTRRRRRI